MRKLGKKLQTTQQTIMGYQKCGGCFPCGCLIVGGVIKSAAGYTTKGLSKRANS